MRPQSATVKKDMAAVLQAPSDAGADIDGDIAHTKSPFRGDERGFWKRKGWGGGEKDHEGYPSEKSN